MTISNTTTRVSYAGDGSSTAFAVPFPFYLSTDLLVIVNGSTVSSGYSVSGGGGSGSTPLTGTVTFSAAPAAGVIVQIVLNPPLTQLVNLVDGTAFPSATLDQVNDRAVQIGLRLNDLLSRAVIAPDGDSSPVVSLPSATARANGTLMFDSSGNVTIGVPVSGTITQGTITGLLSQAFNAHVGDTAYVQLTRQANYSGGTPGNTPSCLRVTSNVGANVTAYEWTGLFIMNNQAIAGQNVALFAQGNSLTSTTGPTWAAVFEGRDPSLTADPTSGRVSVEIDRRDAGTDANGNRVALDVVCTRPLVGGVFTGAATKISYAVRVGSFGDIPSTTIGAGFTVANCNVGFAFDTANATVTAGAFRMAQGQAILWDASGAHQSTYDGTGWAFRVSGSTVVRLNASGSLQIGGPAVPVAIQGTAALSATAGGGQAVPGTVLGYLNVQVSGVNGKVPYFAA